MQPEFGEGVDIVEPLRALLKHSPSVVASDARLVMLETYENTFRIYDHINGDPARQMANVAMHYAENVLDGGLLDERMEQFVERKVGQCFNISFDAFMALPSHMCLRMLEIAGKQLKDESKVAGDVAAKIQTALDKGKG